MRFDYLSIPKLQAPPHKILEVVSLTIVLKILLAFNEIPQTSDYTGS